MVAFARVVTESWYTIWPSFHCAGCTKIFVSNVKRKNTKEVFFTFFTIRSISLAFVRFSSFSWHEPSWANPKGSSSSLAERSPRFMADPVSANLFATKQANHISERALYSGPWDIGWETSKKLAKTKNELPAKNIIWRNMAPRPGQRPTLAKWHTESELGVQVSLLLTIVRVWSFWRQRLNHFPFRSSNLSDQAACVLQPKARTRVTQFTRQEHGHTRDDSGNGGKYVAMLLVQTENSAGK